MVKRKALGYGLSGLIGGEDYAENSGRNTADQTEIYVTDITSSPYQPRQIFNEDEIDELARSIQKNGVLQPILVRLLDTGKYELIAGERRWRAAKKIGLNKVPAIIKNLDDEDVRIVALIENIQREDLSVLEEAEALEKLIQATGKTKEEIAKVVSKSRSYVSNCLRMLMLPEAVKVHLKNGKLTAGHIRALVGHEQAEEIAELAIEKNMSVRQLENLIRRLKKGGDHSNVPTKDQRPRAVADVNQDYVDEVKSIEKTLTDSLNMKVDLTLGASKNTLSIHFDDLSDLDILMEKLAN